MRKEAKLKLGADSQKRGGAAQNRTMRRVVVYRDGNQLAAQIGPDWVEGIAGFGDTVADAVRDLAYSFAEHRHELLRGLCPWSNGSA